MIYIFTDGASRGNPGPGGWGAIIDYNKQIVELGGREDGTTNNRMELSAVIGALSYLKKEEIQGDVTIYTDSKYTIKGITSWIRGWKANGWQTKSKKDVLNRDLWEKLDTLVHNRKIDWQLMPGHSGIPGNERADQIATGYADESNPGLFHGPKSEYPISIDDREVDTEQAQERKEKKDRSRAKAYSYLSLVDNVLKRHKDWTSTEARVKGKKARFRKAISPEDEKGIIEEWGYALEDIQEE